jgi:hypothetical protein
MASPASAALREFFFSYDVFWPRDTRRHLYTNGRIETALGLGFSARKTRPLAIVGLIGYGAYLVGNLIRNR